MTVSKVSTAGASPAPPIPAVLAGANGTEDAAQCINLGHRFSQQSCYVEAEAWYTKAIELSPHHAVAHNNLGWARQMQGDNRAAIEGYETALQFDPHLQVARRNLALLLLRLGAGDRSIELWRDELLSQPESLSWLENLAGTSMQDEDLGFAGRCAALLAEARWGSKFYPRGGPRLPFFTPPRFLSIPKLEHDIEQFRYLQCQGVLGDEFTPIIKEYERTIDRLKAVANFKRAPLDEEAEQAIGHVYNRIVHIRQTSRLTQAFSKSWTPEKIENDYLGNSPGVVVIDDFLSQEALENLRLFCLESTVWSGNRYAHGRLGAFFRDGFNCPLLLQIAEELRAKLSRVIGERYPLRQLWGFKNGRHLPAASNTHADFAAVNVNFWITPSDANLDEKSGGLVIYGVDAPAHWDFESYNSRPDRIEPFLRQQKARAVTIPYRENRAIIFNSDLFHGTDGLNFKPGYENRRVNITMLYGDREDDVHHRGLAQRDAVRDPNEATNAWRSAAFRCKMR